MVFVTGSCGFIGGHMKLGLCNLKTDAVVHMAGISDTSCDDWEKLKTVNVDWTLQLAEDCRRQGVTFVYASSASVYGNGGGPLCKYAESKKMTDDAMLAREGCWYGLRFFNVWGPGEEKKGSQASLIHRLKRGLSEVWAPNAGRDFVHVEDCVAVARWMIINKPPSGVYDVGTGETVRVMDLVLKYGMGTVKVVPVPKKIEGRYQYETRADLRNLRWVGYQGKFRSAV